jgi:NADH-quinone oxidoreductase subunit M
MRDFLLSLGYDRWVLPVLLALPVVGAIIIWVGAAAQEASASIVRAASAGGDADATAGVPPITPAAQFARWAALITFVLEFVVSAGLWWTFDPAVAGWQNAIKVPWIPGWGISFSIGIDGLALVLILLTTFLLPLTVLGSWTSVRSRVPTFYALMLLLTTGMLGVFMSLDLFLFYVMWEVMLIPMYFIIGIWGGERRLYASIKFFLYTFLGSLLMLVAILYVGFHVTGARGTPSGELPNFSYSDLLAHLSVTPVVARWLFGAFFVAFAVKVPMFPFHTWLPDAHTEAPTAGSVILAGIMLKMGTFGFLRFALPLFPSAAIDPTIRAIILVLAVVGILYGALVALVQPDFKRLVAYSSVSHLGFVMLGIFALTEQSVQGAILVMINHGISTGALFLLIGMIYERTHTRMISAYGGIARVVPLFAAILTFVSLSSIGLPGTNGFVGEFLVLIGSFRSEPYFAFFATVGVIFAAAYLLWAIQRILFNPLDKPQNLGLRDLNWRELGLMAPLLASICWLGIYPAPVLRRTQLAATTVVEEVQHVTPPPRSSGPSRIAPPRPAPSPGPSRGPR